jgi:tRNA wybutosine-synthesizing protein 1
MERSEDYAHIIEEAEPDFVEIKSYMHLGRSRLRLEREAMPEHYEIMRFAQRLGDRINYQMVADVPLSRVALLGSGRISRSIFP